MSTCSPTSTWRTTRSGWTTRSSRARRPGNISAGEFVIGAAAQDADDRIIYNSGTGALLYDSDGAGGAAAIQFAQVNTGLGLTHLDFLVV